VSVIIDATPLGASSTGHAGSPVGTKVAGITAYGPRAIVELRRISAQPVWRTSYTATATWSTPTHTAALTQPSGLGVLSKPRATAIVQRTYVAVASLAEA
jgi:hypothetical protein